jgi:hypothetical protein
MRFISWDAFWTWTPISFRYWIPSEKFFLGPVNSRTITPSLWGRMAAFRILNVRSWFFTKLQTMGFSTTVLENFRMRILECTDTSENSFTLN